MVDPYAIVRRITGHELISPNDSRRLIEAVDGLIDEFAGKDARIAGLEAENERMKKKETHASTGAVKELEWARGWMNAEAQTEIGQYTITYRRDGSFEWGIGILKGWASSWDAAKSAAQADYERRILSALVPSHQVKHNP